MNKTTLIKFSFVIATAVVALGATVPQKAMARDTATIPIIKSGKHLLKGTKDNGTVPVITTPSTTDVTANPSPSPFDSDFTITITVNEAPTVDTVLDLETSHPNAIGLPATVVVPAGTTTITVPVSVTPGDAKHHKNVRISVSSNGTTVDTKVRVHYQNEVD